MKMQLISLTLDNFKDFQHWELRFDGRSASIYDTFTWLLFGKDSHGKKEFDLKPLTPEGLVRDHEAMHAGVQFLWVSPICVENFSRILRSAQPAVLEKGEKA